MSWAALWGPRAAGERKLFFLALRVSKDKCGILCPALDMPPEEKCWEAEETLVEKLLSWSVIGHYVEGWGRWVWFSQAKREIEWHPMTSEGHLQSSCSCTSYNSWWKIEDSNKCSFKWSVDFEKSFAKNKFMKDLCSSGGGGRVKARKAVEFSRAISKSVD